MTSHARLNISAGLASVSVALILVGAKLWAFEQTSALSIATSLVDSALDLAMALGGLWAIYYAARPPDDDHTFGHTSAEDLVALSQSVLILLSSAFITTTALRRLFVSPAPRIQSESIGLGVMVFSIVLTLGLVLWQGKVARRTGSKVVAADSLHYIGDLIPNIGAILALLAARFWDWHSVDSIVALGAAAYLAYGAHKIGRSAWDALMDRSAPQDMISGIEALAMVEPGIDGFHDLKTRTAGSMVFVHLHIELDGDLPLRQAHDIGKSLKAKILQAYPNTDVIIHKDVSQ
ncbi:ferrous-iron efflux pump FieF [Pacificibacter maritimus]|uniref:Ferrous-iron efflux pump FieF n=1 Tax=Pacificibacter maritimus TaxID=762213 RepID=A0A3N4UJ16_9RHOB|nr:cation diffusion facilitator family transporter [Pacificibacter maritimus]RPE67259.1 ferrous-iron efflux pump FieF [Pacificibacter maritimus]